ncbi:glutamate--cysteine ligase [Streptomyces sp. SL13]|uniref:Putative glutamate--cysteine ligase 2 n=1 Tax=Streptantibioticus silvisoli TaxID=2705255 RepID=A0AA90KAD8_9ACTN|nr:glutamate--cysteine ligase [Streptantibioticus silvisoli]MDI5963326.1 glutamate--cysteine ligase [Streptantibioticus silvisoli]MDI5971997.1 glutamate--cysteine ligase [Streptantibioticus silvisoli]
MVTVGVEEEYLLLDADTGSPVSRGAHVRGLPALAPMVRCGEVDAELLQAQLEVATPVCGALAEVDAHLRRLRAALGEAVAGAGCRIAASGTAPRLGQSHVTAEPRYLAMWADAPQLVVEQLINGMHVHVAVPDPDSAVAALNRLRPWLPVLVAMAANSPFWDGRDTGFASWRTVVFGRWPVSGPPPVFAGARDYAERTGRLLATGVIRDLGQIYWQARLSQRYPTLEVRALDVQLCPREAVTFAGLVRALVVAALTDARAGVPGADVPGELLTAANWRAARHGLGGTLVSPLDGTLRPAAEVVIALVDHVTPALKTTGDLDRVTEGVDRLLREGTGAHQQRAAFAAGGRAGLLDLLGAGCPPA